MQWENVQGYDDAKKDKKLLEDKKKFPLHWTGEQRMEKVYVLCNPSLVCI